MPTASEFSNWLQVYVAACTENDASKVADLFAGDAVYHYTPFDPPWHGVDEIADKWEDDAENLVGFRCDAIPIFVAEDRGIAEWWAEYPAEGFQYRSAFVVRFDDQGKATEFREWYVRRKLSGKEAGPTE